MIFEGKQTDRYLRQILITEIMGAGQKKLLQSSVVVYGDTVQDSAPLIYYMAAAGIGQVYCSFGDDSGLDTLVSNVHDLNDNTLLKLLDSSISNIPVPAL